jgi:hypothetical protein
VISIYKQERNQFHIPETHTGAKVNLNAAKYGIDYDIPGKRYIVTSKETGKVVAFSKELDLFFWKKYMELT